MRIRFARLSSTEATWVDLGSNVEVYVSEGKPAKLCYPLGEREQAIARLEAWADHGYYLSATETPLPHADGWMVSACWWVNTPDEARNAAEERGRHHAESRAGEGAEQGLGDYPGTWRDFLDESPFEELTQDEKAITRELARVSHRAAEAHWNARRAQGGVLIKRIERDVTDLLREERTLSPAIADRLEEQAQRLLHLTRLLRSRDATREK